MTNRSTRRAPRRTTDSLLASCRGRTGGRLFLTYAANSSVVNLRPTAAMVTLPGAETLTHMTFPSVVKVAGGFLVACRAATGHADLGGRIALLSTTDGREGTDPTILTVTDAVAGSTGARDPSLTVLANGDLLLNWYDGGPRKSYRARSSDGGATWTARTALPFTWTDTTFISSPIAVLPSGAWLATAYGKNTGATYYEVAVIRSTDEGATWSAPVTAATSTTISYVEPNVISTGGTSALMMIRADGNWTY